MFTHYNAIKPFYEKSIFVENVEEVLTSDNYFNRADEWLVKEMSVGYMMMALETHPEIKEKLTDKDIDDLIYSIACRMDDESFITAIEESKKYNLNV